MCVLFVVYVGNEGSDCLLCVCHICRSLGSECLFCVCYIWGMRGHSVCFVCGICG